MADPAARHSSRVAQFTAQMSLTCRKIRMAWCRVGLVVSWLRLLLGCFCFGILSLSLLLFSHLKVNLSSDCMFFFFNTMSVIVLILIFEALALSSVMPFCLITTSPSLVTYA